MLAKSGARKVRPPASVPRQERLYVQSSGVSARQLPGEQHSTWLPYVKVDDVKAATKKAIALDGNIVKDVTEVPDRGIMSIITDPTGATQVPGHASARHVYFTHST